MPENVRMMAPTATATHTTRQQVCHRMGMLKLVLVIESPNQSNIKYMVKAANNLKKHLHHW